MSFLAVRAAAETEHVSECSLTQAGTMPAAKPPRLSESGHKTTAALDLSGLTAEEIMVADGDLGELLQPVAPFLPWEQVGRNSGIR